MQAELIQKVSADVASRIPHSGKLRSRSSDKERNAKALGLKDSSNGEGSFAAAVGMHPDLPNVIIKVVQTADPFFTFAKASLDGLLNSKHLPEIYSVTQVDDTAVILVEYIPHPMTDVEFICDDVGHRMYYRPESFREEPLSSVDDRSSMMKQVLDFCDKYGCKIDTHAGNFRKREDGIWVFIDPVWSPACPRH